MLNKQDLINYFFEGIKPKNNMKIGVEHEKFILSKNTHKPISYEEKNGIKNILLLNHNQVVLVLVLKNGNYQKF